MAGTGWVSRGPGAHQPSSGSSQEVFTELQEKYGEIEEMNVCDNLGDHLVGNVYVKVSAGPSLEPRSGGTAVPDGHH